MDYPTQRPSLYPLIGERIMLARRRAGVTQAALGARLGISAAAVSHLEQGRATRAHLDNLAAVADALGVPIAALVVLEHGEDSE